MNYCMVLYKGIGNNKVKKSNKKVVYTSLIKRRGTQDRLLLECPCRAKKSTLWSN